MSEWQPIKTAPYGEDVLVCWVKSRTMAVASVYDEGCAWEDGNDNIVNTPTHWMYLPEPPEQQ